MEPRRLLAGRYELREQLGDSTWLATDLELAREVAVRFGEVAGATLSHPSIARVFDQGEEDGEPYAVLEYLPGGTLAERGALTEEDAAGLSAALAYAHAQGVAHGALDADAVLFDAEGRAKLARFRGEGDAEADVAALAALRSDYAATEVRAPVAEEATLVQPPPPAEPRRRRWGLLAAVLAALALAAAGIAAAFLAGGDDDGGAGATVTTDPITSATLPTDTEEPEPPPTTTDETTTATTETQPPTTTAETEPPTTATVAPPVPTEPPLPTVPPTDTLELPTEPPTTAELPPPPTETAP